MSQNVLYDDARRAFAEAEINWPAGDLYTLLVNADYTFAVSHTTLSDISGSSGGPRDYAPSPTASFKGYTLNTPLVAPNGAVYGDPVTFITVPAGRPDVRAVVLYKKDPGNDEAASPLIYYAGIATGLPITPNGGDIIVTWSTGTNRIFRL